MPTLFQTCGLATSSQSAMLALVQPRRGQFTYPAMKRFLDAGLESGMRLSTAASGYDIRMEKINFTVIVPVCQPCATGSVIGRVRGSSYAHLVQCLCSLPPRRRLFKHSSQ